MTSVSQDGTTKALVIVTGPWAFKFARSTQGRQTSAIKLLQGGAIVPGLLISVLISILILPFPAMAQATLQQFEATNEFQRALAAIDEIRRRKQLQCVLATANSPLCRCLSQRLSPGTNIQSYASLEDNGTEYQALSAADKRAADQCVSEKQ
jgi:hypothetical protein